jgi:hypothetical protein
LLVFLHTFFSIAQFRKKPCNPVFNVLYNFNKSGERSVCSSIADVPGKCFALRAQVLNQRPPYIVVLTTGIPSVTEEIGFLKKLLDTKSKRENFKKPCGRTTQFSAGLALSGSKPAPDRAH